MKPYALQVRLDGPWLTLSRYDTLEEAEAALRDYPCDEDEEVRVKDETRQADLFE